MRYIVALVFVLIAALLVYSQESLDKEQIIQLNVSLDLCTVGDTLYGEELLYFVPEEEFALLISGQVGSDIVYMRYWDDDNKLTKKVIDKADPARVLALVHITPEYYVAQAISKISIYKTRH